MKLVKIKSIEKKKYTGFVYDLTVADNHSYNINGIIVHNSVCETRVRTGVGVPQLTAIELVKSGTSLPIVSDGGIRTSGDVAKALAFGASSVMLGSLLAGTDESPGDVFVEGHGNNQKKYKMFRGSASAAIKLEKIGVAKHVEGASTLISVKGPVENVINDLMDGVRSSMSYLGASTIKDLQENCSYVRVSSAGLREAHPHLLLE